MLITKIGSDYITINEENIKDEQLLKIDRVHLIKFDFKQPSIEKVEAVMVLWNKTNRFVIANNIKIYNDILKRTIKKYYVENTSYDNLITFFRRNNKVLLNVCNLTEHDKSFVLNKNTLSDVLKNIEVIQIEKECYNMYSSIFKKWNGNVIIQ